METITGQVPVFVTQAGDRVLFGPQQTRGVLASFHLDPARPHLVAISTHWFVLWVSRDGLTDGLDSRQVEAGGDITIRPYEAPDVSWLVIDIDRPTFPASQISAQQQNVAGFLGLADAVLGFGDGRFERMVPRPAVVREIEREWPLRFDGGAA